MWFLFALIAPSAAALVVNIHITHHGGTQICHIAQENVRAADAACYVPHVQFPPRDASLTHYARQVNESFDFVNWEFRWAPHPVPLDALGWHEPHIVSILAVRDPIDRLLAGDGFQSSFGPVVSVRDGGDPLRKWTAVHWDKYAHSAFTDSYQLRILAGGGADQAALARAQALTKRMTYVLDLACFHDNLEALARHLGWHYNFGTVAQHPHTTTPIVNRLHNYTLLNELKSRNRYDIEFYRWAQKRALVVCGAKDLERLNY